MESRKGVIYGLYCACDNCKDKREWIRYVGQTVVDKPSRRLDQHRFESRSEGAYLAVHLWMRKHGEYNIKMKILEDEVPEEQLDDRETHWIAELKTFKDDENGGFNLTRDGKGSEITDKSRKRQREAFRKTRAQMKDLRVIQNFPGKTAEEVVQFLRARYAEDKEYGFQEMSRDLGIPDVKFSRRIIRNEEYPDPTYTPPEKENQPSQVRKLEAGLLGERLQKRWDTAREIRRVWLEGDLTSYQVGDMFGLDHTSVWHIVNNRTYPDPNYQNTRGRKVTSQVKARISEKLKGRPKPDGFGKRGESSYKAILTEEKVSEILQRLHSGEMGFHLAKEYGVTPTTISCIKKGKTWVDVPRPEGFKS